MNIKNYSTLGITQCQESIGTIASFFKKEPSKLALAIDYVSRFGIDLGFATVWYNRVEMENKTIFFASAEKNIDDAYNASPLNYVNTLAFALRRGVIYKIIDKEVNLFCEAGYVVATSLEGAAMLVHGVEFAPMDEGDEL